MSGRRDLADQLLRVLSAAQCDRPDHDRWVEVDDYSVPAWVLNERRVMLDEVNRLRAIRNLPAVSGGDVERVESMAVGHSDYSRKFAYECAELVVGGGSDG